MTKPIFAIDGDDVILATGFMKKRWIEENIRDEQLIDKTRTIASISPYECNLTQLAPIIGRSNYFRMVNDVYGPEWTAATQPVPGALEGIEALAQNGNVEVITARRAWEVQNTVDWLRENGAAIRSIKYVDDPDFSCVTAVAGSKKVGIAKHLGARMLVDDDERHMPKEPVGGLDCLLFGPGDRTSFIASAPHVIVAPTWTDVVSYSRRYTTG